MHRRGKADIAKTNDASRTADEFYDELGAGYDQMINWGSRLERETPFFRKVFNERAVKSVLDCACGTGRHAIEFAQWGHEVSACDISGEMLRLARHNASGQGASIDFFEAGLTDIAEKAHGKTFDAVVCLGNSLPHLLTQHDLDHAIRSIKRVLAPGGVFIAQIRNYQRILKENLRFMPPTSAEVEGKEYMFFRMLDIHSTRHVDFHIIRFQRESGKWTHTIQTTRLRPMMKRHMDASFKRTGFQQIKYYGDYSFTPFTSAGTLDLISVAS